MRPSSHLMGVLKIFEGYNPIAKQEKGDRIGVITGGHGTITHPSGVPVKVGDVFTPEYAEYCLGFELNSKCIALDKILDSYHLVLNQNQFDALGCFIYNLGTGWLRQGFTMGDALISHDLHKISSAFLIYNKGTKYILGVPYKAVLEGLDKRRKYEKELFESKQVF